MSNHKSVETKAQSGSDCIVFKFFERPMIKNRVFFTISGSGVKTGIICLKISEMHSLLIYRKGWRNIYNQNRNQWYKCTISYAFANFSPTFCYNFLVVFFYFPLAFPHFLYLDFLRWIFRFHIAYGGSFYWTRSGVRYRIPWIPEEPKKW